MGRVGMNETLVGVESPERAGGRVDSRRPIVFSGMLCLAHQASCHGFLNPYLSTLLYASFQHPTHTQFKFYNFWNRESQVGFTWSLGLWCKHRSLSERNWIELKEFIAA